VNGRGRVGIGVLLAVAVSLAMPAGVGSAKTPAAKQPAYPSLPKNVDQALQRELALLAHIPRAVRSSCLLLDSSRGADKPGGHYVAELECRPDAATTIVYRQYADPGDLRFDFDQRYARRREPKCGGRDTYSVGRHVVGEWVCYADEGGNAVEVAWTFRPLGVLALIDRTDGDVAAARHTWSDEAGPDRAAHPVPRVLTVSAARRGSAELLAQIPDAEQFRCQPVDLSRADNLLNGVLPSPNLWADAMVSCDNNTVPGSVTYRRYRDADAYRLAYDPQRYLEYAEDGDAACGDGYEAAWSVDGKDVGRVACAFEGAAPDGEAHILWTYDPDRIVAEAVVTQQSSAQPELDWWRNSAGPVASS
jgi:hypothetical protein